MDRYTKVINESTVPVDKEIIKKDLEKISSFIRGKKVIALGGVTPDKFPFLKSKGFLGAALLGYFFPEVLNEIETTT